MKFFQLYQYLAPLILLPLAYWLWWHRYGGNHWMVLTSLSLPVVYAYVIPGIGTNWLQLWEFNTRFRLGNFRPHHGLLFGTATSLFAFVTLSYPPSPSVMSIIRDAFLMGTVLAFWNWLYDMYAIEVGFIRVFTRRQFEGMGSAAVAADYAPILFGTFGFCYGLALRMLEQWFGELRPWQQIGMLLFVCQVACLTLPVLAYVAVSFLRTGESGLQSYKRVGHES